jgi:hypothetical protein
MRLPRIEFVGQDDWSTSGRCDVVANYVTTVD